MKNITVLGPGCTTCKNTMARIERIAKEKGVAINIQKIEALDEIISYGIMSTPGVVIDGKVVHAGGLPSRKKIEIWLA